MNADFTGASASDFDPRDLIDYEVYDRNNESIGDVSALWLGQNDEPSYIGVQTTWLVGSHHVIPTYGADVNHHSQVIRLPYSEDDVKNAPTHNAGTDLELEEEQDILSYYRNRGGSIPESDIGELQERESFFTGPRPLERDTEGDVEVPLHEEQMSVGKRRVDAGGVRLRKIVRTETVQQPVELSHEDVVVERVPASGKAATGRAFEAEDIFIPLRRDEAVVSKEASLREQVRVRKEARPEEHTVSGEIRKEDIELDEERGTGKRR